MLQLTISITFNQDIDFTRDIILFQDIWRWTMTVLVFLTLLFTVNSAFISENVVFHKVTTITPTRSRWLVTFVIDLKPFELFINRLFSDILQSSSLAQEILRRYDRHGKENLMNIFSNLKSEFQSLMVMHNFILDTFKSQSVRKSCRMV